MIIRFEKYNESIRSRMHGPSDERLKDRLSNMDIDDIFRYVKKYKLDDSFLPSERKVYYYLMNLNIDEWLDFIDDYDLINKYSNKLLPTEDEIKDYLKTLSIDKWIRLINKHNLDDKFLPTRKQINEHIFNEQHMKDFSRKFYRKATLIPIDNRYIKLKSYNTIVVEYDNRTRRIKINGWYSSTTARHINAFIEYLGGYKRLSKKEMDEKPIIKI